MADQTPADQLREAATLLRERATAATPGPWSGDTTGTVCADADLRPDPKGGEILPPDGPMEVAECYRNEQAGERGANAFYIAAMHPDVGLAVADWLDATAHKWTVAAACGLVVSPTRRGDREALAVARAVLGAS